MITAALEQEYGLQESSTATTFLNMAQSIDKFASSSGGSIDSLIGDLHANETAAKQTQKAMDDYAKEYTAKQVNNFLEGKSNADSYIDSLEKIPKTVTTTVTTKYATEGEAPGTVTPNVGAKASGGPIDPMRPYLVGEEGPELITPRTSGYVTPTDALQRALASSNQIGSAGGASSTTTNSSSITYQMPIYTNQSPAVLQQSLAVMEAMSA